MLFERSHQRPTFSCSHSSLPRCPLWLTRALQMGRSLTVLLHLSFQCCGQTASPLAHQAQSLPQSPHPRTCRCCPSSLLCCQQKAGVAAPLQSGMHHRGVALSGAGKEVDAPDQLRLSSTVGGCLGWRLHRPSLRQRLTSSMRAAGSKAREPDGDPSGFLRAMEASASLCTCAHGCDVATAPPAGAAVPVGMSLAAAAAAAAVGSSDGSHTPVRCGARCSGCRSRAAARAAAVSGDGWPPPAAIDAAMSPSLSFANSPVSQKKGPSSMLLASSSECWSESLSLASCWLGPLPTAFLFSNSHLPVPSARRQMATCCAVAAGPARACPAEPFVPPVADSLPLISAAVADTET